VPTGSAYLTASQTFIARGSTGTYFDNTGALQTAAANTARQAYDPVTHAAQGILTEPRRTNYVRNSEFAGISVGTYTNQYIGTGNHWRLEASLVVENPSLSIVGAGTINGMSYLDIRMQGTNNTSNTAFLNFKANPSDVLPVSAGQKTVFSGWLGVTSYSSTGGSCYIKASNRSYAVVKSYLTAAELQWSAVSAFAPFQTGVLTHGTDARFADGWFFIALPPSVTCDMTVRIAAPQFELGSAPTSYIPTNGTTVTRAQDIYQQF
jgi:hypothetical protein